jgi:hypothetical protein
MAASLSLQPSAMPVAKPLSLIPVGLKEAALDSPSFRSTVVHFSDQIDAVEKWLDGYVKATSKLAQEVGVLEDVVNSFLTASNPPDSLSEAALDHDYTVLAMRRYGQGAHEFWSHAIGGFKKCQYSVVEPIRATLLKDFRPFKETRRLLDQAQKNYDASLARYASQVKVKEASALREDAFQLHTERKLYLKASMDYCIAAPQLRAALDSLLIKVFSDQWLEMKDLRESTTTMFTGYGHEIERIRSWSQQINQGQIVLQKELLSTRKKIEESAEAALRPSRDLEEYTVSSIPTGPSLGTRPRASSRVGAEGSSAFSKQGWLFMRTTAGRPARTTWTRRWFYVKNGVFGWLTQGSKSGGVEESEKIGVLLCSVRPGTTEERRFCFEVKTKDTTLMLQAETQGELIRWMSVFDSAKKEALEEPVLGGQQSRRPNLTSNAAFAVNPALAPELAEKRNDVLNASTQDDVGSNLSNLDPSTTDVSRTDSGASARRRRTVTVTSEGDSSREHAARLLSKLDIHRRSITGATGSNRTVSSSVPATPSPNLGVGGPASMSRSSLQPANPPNASGSSKQISSADSASLAPTNIANPPMPTNLSKTAVMVVAERGLDIGSTDQSNGGAPGSLLSNVWGTANYGHLSRIERGEVGRVKDKSTSLEPSLSADQSTSQASEGISPGSTGPVTAITAPTAHRRTVSEAQDVQPRGTGGTIEYPPNYPVNLRVHDAQLRIIFPTIPLDQKVLLVFRASWNPSENQDLPGRVYVTNSAIYFYSHYHGFVLVSGFPLSRLVDLAVENKSHHDFLYFTLQSLNGKDEVHTVTTKIFLEPLQLLQRRLEYIVSTAQSHEHVELEDMITALIDLDDDLLDDGSPGLNDWDATPRAHSFNSPSRRAAKGLKPNLRFDRSLYGGDSSAMIDPDTQQIKLPPQAVKYTPKDMANKVTDRTFPISSKAMFHLLFGDKSAVSQMLYFQRRTKVIKQYPWTPVQGGYWSRRFEYDVVVRDRQGRPETLLISDTQTIDVYSDHLCYSVTDLKTPWHLPRPQDFSFLTKIVITHVAKSQCNLAIFTKIQWHKRSGFSDTVIEKHGLEDLRQDAIQLDTMVADQVAKLSKADAQTRKAVAIFGDFGQVTDATQVSSPDLNILVSAGTVMLRQCTMAELTKDAAISFLTSAATSGVSALLDAGQALVKNFSAHSTLLVLLGLSLAIHLFTSTSAAQSWYTDRSAARYMSRLGVQPSPVMSKAIYLNDIYELAQAPVLYNDSATTEWFVIDIFLSQGKANMTTARKHSKEYLPPASTPRYFLHRLLTPNPPHEVQHGGCRKHANG